MRQGFPLCFLFLAVLSVSARQIRVPLDYTSVQMAIDYSNLGDTVLVADGTYFENINFRGKALTVASHFILDRDSSHIEETILNGSRPKLLSRASVVSLNSGEDSTSVLMGFTIIGGEGTLARPAIGEELLGGGIFMMNSGGSICHNIIELNSLNNSISREYALGAGIYAHIHNERTAAFRHNIIRRNSIYNGEKSLGGGLFLDGGSFVVENNRIENNQIAGETSKGGGIHWMSTAPTHQGAEIIFRNNHVCGNTATAYNEQSSTGGGIFLGFSVSTLEVQFYNNIVSTNMVDGWGGGLGIVGTPAVLCQNTLYDNHSKLPGENLAVNSNLVMFNNLIGSPGWPKDFDVYFFLDSGEHVIAHHNLHAGGLLGVEGLESTGNIQAIPLLNASWTPEEACPGIDWGLDSMRLPDRVIAAPASDIYGNPRTGPGNAGWDLGAVESPFKGKAYIPDKLFFRALQESGVDRDGSGFISFEEANLVHSLNVRGRDIVDLRGIEAFGRLETLMCSNNELKILDLSANAALEYLDCNNNELLLMELPRSGQITSLDARNNRLNRLDLSAHHRLQSLKVRNNYLAQLNLASNEALCDLDCGYNLLNNLELGTHEILNTVYCDHNRMSELGLPRSEKLEVLLCNDNELTYLDVSACVNLEILHCHKNKLRSLDLSNNRALGTGGVKSNELNLCGMSSLFGVCVPSAPFPPEHLDLRYTGSPNLYFTTHCDSVYCPVICAPDTVFPQQFFDLFCSLDARVYLFEEGPLPDPLFFETRSLRSVQLQAQIPVLYHLKGFPTEKTYVLLARGNNGMFSRPHPIWLANDQDSITTGMILSIYPNPASGQVVLETALSPPYRLEIFNGEGQLAWKGNVREKRFVMDCSEWARGIYFLRIWSSDMPHSMKLILN